MFRRGGSTQSDSAKSLTSTPVNETIWAILTEEMAIKVIRGYPPAFSLFRSLNRSFLLVVVRAVGKDMVMMRMSGYGLILIEARARESLKAIVNGAGLQPDQHLELRSSSTCTSMAPVPSGSADSLGRARDKRRCTAIEIWELFHSASIAHRVADGR